MKIFFDENFPPQIAKALQILQSPRTEEDVEVYNIADYFGQGVSDENWIPEIAKKNGIVITQDLNIHRSRNQKELLKNSGLRIVFFKPPSNKGYTYWEFVENVIKNWNDIKKTSRKNKDPFAYVLRPRSSKLEPL